MHDPGDRTVDFRLAGTPDVRWVGCRLSQVDDDADGGAGIIGFLADVTHRREAEHALRRSKEYLRVIVAAITDSIISTDRDGRIRWFNRSAQDTFGFNADEMRTMTLDGLLEGGDDTPGFRELTDRVSGAGGGGRQVVGRRSDGSRVPLHLAVRPSDPGAPAGYTVVARDLTAELAEEENARARAREQRALRTVATLAARQEPVTVVSGAALREATHLLGADGGVLVRYETRGTVKIIGLVPPDGHGGVAEGDVIPTPRALRGLLDDPEALVHWDAPDWWNEEPRPGGAGVSVSVPVVIDGAVWGGAMTLAFPGHPEPEALEATISNFASLVALAVSASNQRAELARMATTDELTGLPNRRSFTDRLHGEIGRAARYGRPLSLVLFDIDRFKRINDTHGHATGDRVIRELATLFGGQVRRGETVARVGGEEFAWVMPEADVHDAVAACQRAMEYLRAHTVDGVGTVTVSMGVAPWTPGSSVEDLMTHADMAMYEAKNTGRGRVCAAAPAGPVALPGR